MEASPWRQEENNKLRAELNSMRHEFDARQLLVLQDENRRLHGDLNSAQHEAARLQVLANLGLTTVAIPLAAGLERMAQHTTRFLVYCTSEASGAPSRAAVGQQ